METIEHTLAEVTGGVLETMAFALVMPEVDDADTSEAMTRATVRFDGAFGGVLTLSIASSQLPELAGNMLGLEDEPPEDEQQQDALGELANVVCGNVLTALAGPKTVFDLQRPEVAEGEPPTDAPAEGALWSARVMLDEAPVATTLILDKADALTLVQTTNP